MRLNSCFFWLTIITKNSFSLYVFILLAVGHRDLPKSVCNRCVIEVVGGVFVLPCCFLYFSVDLWIFEIGLSQMA